MKFAVKFSKRARIILPIVAAAICGATPAPAPLQLDRVVVLMRHGVRPPTKSPPMEAGIAAAPWPNWAEKPGYLTRHGAAAIEALGRDDRAVWRAAGLIPASGCIRARMIADSDQRTVATAEYWARGLLPGCASSIEHKPEGTEDVLFGPIEHGDVKVDAGLAEAAVLKAAGDGGIAGAERRLKPELDRIDAILCGGPTPSCGVARFPTGLKTATNARAKLTGALDRASTAAQILLLEYVDGKPMSEIGWGRASASDITRLGVFHATEFALLARPRYLAARNFAAIGPLMLNALIDPAVDAPRITMISGHDTNIANLGGLLDLHWRIAGFAADDPSPGGAIVIERLRDRQGKYFVRAHYRSQTLDQIRAGGSGRAQRQPMALPGCRARGEAGLCTEAEFIALMRERLAR